MDKSLFKAVIMAAGEGTRMKSSLPKVLHEVQGKPLVAWVCDSVKEITDKPVIIYGNGGEMIKDVLGDNYEYVLQKERLGTGHAVMQATEEIAGSRYTLVLAGDMPLIKGESIMRLAEGVQEKDISCLMLTASPEKTPAFGRIIRDEKGNITSIVEDRDCNEEQKKIKELNISIYCFRTEDLLMALGKLDTNNAQNEYYLTDVISILYREGKTVDSIQIEDISESMGVNTRVQLAEAGKALRKRINEKLMLSGVTMIDPDSTYIDEEVVVGKDTVIYPGVILEGRTVVGENCILYQGSRIHNSKIGDNTTVENSVLLDAEVGNETKVGPNAYLRPGTVIGDQCRIGDFVETKNAKIGNGTKVSHLTYIGDAVLGEDINVGCGVVFVNYDGKEKNITTVEDGAFIGCNTNLVAPVKVGKGAYVAAGTTITRDVPEGALAIGRSRQEIKENWAVGKYRISRK